MTYLANMKKKLARVNSKSWHYRLVDSVHLKIPRKTCVYYWYSVPLALLKGASVLIIVALVVVFGGGIGWIAGFTMNFNNDQHRLFFPYKTKKDWSRKRFAPWEVLLVAGLVLGAQQLLVRMNWSVATRLAIYTMRAAIAIGIGGTLAFLLGRAGVRGLRRRSEDINNAWNKVCPELEVVYDESTAEKAP